MSGLLLVFLALFSPAPTFAQFKALETAHLKLISYGEAQSFLISHIARCYENALAANASRFGYTPTEQTIVFVQDNSDYGNAGAGALPWNHVTISIAPLNYAFETSPSNERMNSTMNHEVVHLIAADKPAASDRFFRGLFTGKVIEEAESPLSILYGYLTCPRRSAPRWYHEGIAVFMETWLGGGLGRSLSAYDEMVFRAIARDSATYFDIIGLESEAVATDFQTGVNSYLYGARFMSYLALTRDPETVIRWVSRSDSSSAYYATQFRRVYGISLDSAWDEWLAYERVFQKRNLDTIALYPITAGRPISTHGLGSVSRAWRDSATNDIYVAVYYPGDRPKLVALNSATGQMRTLAEIKGPALFYATSLTYDPAGRRLFYTTDNNEMRDVVIHDLLTGAEQVILKDERIGDMAFNRSDSALWGIRHYNGISTIVRIPAPYTVWRQVWSLPYGKDLYDIDISPDGSVLVGSLGEISGRQTLVSMVTAGLLAGDSSMTTLYDFGNAIPENFTFSPDGRFLWGSSFYTGVSNVFRYDRESGAIAAFSNAETGFFRPTPVGEDSLFVFRFGAGGFQPIMIPQKEITDINPIKYLGQQVVLAHPTLKEWVAPAPSKVILDSLVTYRGEFSPTKSFALASMYPIVEGYDNHLAGGMRFTFSSPVGAPTASLTVSYSPTDFLPENERLHATASYSWLHWTIDGSYNGADFYDIFGPTKSSRKGRTLGVKYKRTLIDDAPRKMSYMLSGAVYDGMNRAPSYQNVSIAPDRFYTFGGNLSFSDLRSTIGAVDQESGKKFTLSSSNRLIRRRIFARLTCDYDLALARLFPHSVLWARSSAGAASGDRDVALSNFYFGGFGNNWVDYQNEKRYRASYAFPGVELNELSGHTYVRGMLEWTLPAIRFRHIGVSTLYATWLRPALFGAVLVTDPDFAPYRVTTYNVGGQLDLRLTLLSRLKATFSAGYGLAMRPGVAPTDEYMMSLKIL